MADRRPLVMVFGRLRELAMADTLAWALLSGIPAFASRWPTFAEVDDKPATYAPSPHTHAAADIVSGTFGNARISAGSVVQHQAALAIDFTQLFNMQELSSWRTRTTAEFGQIGSPNVWTGSNTFNGALQSNSTTSPGFVLNRTNQTTNSSIEARTTAGSIFFGYGASGTFSVGPTNNLTSGNWLDVSAVGIVVTGNVIASGTLNGAGAILSADLVLPYGRMRAVSNALVISHVGSTGRTIYWRPNGDMNTVGQAVLSSDGLLEVFAVTASGAVSDALGDVRLVPGVVRNAATTLTAAMSGGSSIKTNTTAYTYTVPSGLPNGWTHTITNDGSNGNITIAAGSGVTLIRGTTTGNVVLAAGQSATLCQMPTANRVRVYG